MPEGYYKREPYPRPHEHWLDKAAREGQLIRCRCKRCHRVVHYIAADLLPILGPQHRAAVDPPFPCRCGEQARIAVECIVPAAGDYGHLEVRRPAGVRQVQLWRTVLLGDLVQNDVRKLEDKSAGPLARLAKRQNNGE